MHKTRLGKLGGRWDDYVRWECEAQFQKQSVSITLGESTELDFAKGDGSIVIRGFHPKTKQASIENPKF